MNDKELLELAAKAAGMNAGGEYVDGGDEFTHLRVQRAKGQNWFKWTPLTDDGDALRLAVKLMIRVSVNRAFRLSIPGSVTVEYPDRDGCYFALGEAVTNGDPYAATRRAIVRAAAEIGRQMEVSNG